eukprot:14313223-Alexandrium_andersonii.AAC.1
MLSLRAQSRGVSPNPCDFRRLGKCDRARQKGELRGHRGVPPSIQIQLARRRPALTTSQS